LHPLNASTPGLLLEMKPSDFPPPAPDLLNLISKYLTSHGFTNTAHTLNKDRKLHSRVGKWEDNKQMRKGDLGEIFREWEGRQRPVLKASKKGKVKQTAEETQDSDTGECYKRG
jgi:hypothetical protein